MTEITDAEAAEILWASSSEGEAALRAAWDKTKALGLGTRAVDMADIRAPRRGSREPGCAVRGLLHRPLRQCRQRGTGPDRGDRRADADPARG